MKLSHSGTSNNHAIHQDLVCTCRQEDNLPCPAQFFTSMLGEYILRYITARPGSLCLGHSNASVIAQYACGSMKRASFPCVRNGQTPVTVLPAAGLVYPSPPGEGGQTDMSQVYFHPSQLFKKGLQGRSHIGKVGFIACHSADVCSLVGSRLETFLSPRPSLAPTGSGS